MADLSVGFSGGESLLDAPGCLSPSRSRGRKISGGKVYVIDSRTGKIVLVHRPPLWDSLASPAFFISVACAVLSELVQGALPSKRFDILDVVVSF